MSRAPPAKVDEIFPEPQPDDADARVRMSRRHGLRRAGTGTVPGQAAANYRVANVTAGKRASLRLSRGTSDGPPCFSLLELMNINKFSVSGLIFVFFAV